MGVKTFSQFQTDLTYELGNRSDISTYVDDWINVAYMDFCTRDTFPGLKQGVRFSFPALNRIDTTKATADGVKYVSVPSGLLFIYTVKDATSDHKLKKMSVRDYARKTGLSDTDQESAPLYYCRIHDRLYFAPTPDDTYALEIYYRKRPALLSASTDVTEIDAMWDEPILKLALIQSLRRLKVYDQADVEEKAWDKMMAAKVGILGQEDVDYEHVITPDYAYKVLSRR